MMQDSVQVKAILEHAPMPLRGWASNNSQLDSEVHVEEQVEISILGMVWNRKSDTLSLKPCKGKGVINQKWVAYPPNERTRP